MTTPAPITPLHTAKNGDTAGPAHQPAALGQALPGFENWQALTPAQKATQGDDPWQVIPTAWVLLAQERWRKRNKPAAPLSGAGLDPSRGGADKASLAKRYDNWFDEVVHWPGKMVPPGPALAALVNNDLSPLIGDGPQPYINVDVVGVGSSPFDSLTSMFTTVYPVNGADASDYRDRSGRLKMRNRRAEMYWRMRDALDPEHGDDLALPPDPELLADLCSTRYEVTTAGVIMEDKDKVRQRIGRSPDVGEAVLMALYPYPSENNGVVEYYHKAGKRLRIRERVRVRGHKMSHVTKNRSHVTRRNPPLWGLSKTKSNPLKPN